MANVFSTSSKKQRVDFFLVLFALYASDLQCHRLLQSLAKVVQTYPGLSRKFPWNYRDRPEDCAGVEYSAYSFGVRRLFQKVPRVGLLLTLRVNDRSPKNSHTRNRRTWVSGSECCLCPQLRFQRSTICRPGSDLNPWSIFHHPYEQFGRAPGFLPEW